MSSDFLDKDLIYVNSADRLGGSSNDFTVDLSSQIRTPNDYDTATLISFTCPKSYYVFNSSNNIFTVNENGALTTITIPSGNYTFSTFNTQLGVLLAACSWTYVCTNSTITGKYTITVSGNGGLQPIFDFSGDYSPYLILGFDQDQYTFTADSLTGPNIVNFQKTNTIELCTDLVRKNVLAVIIPDTSDFTTISYIEYNAQFTSQPLVQNNITSARFYILDGNTGQLLDINGLNFNFTFVMYKKNNYYRHMLEDRQQELQIQQLEAELKKLEESLDQIPNAKV